MPCGYIPTAAGGLTRFHASSTGSRGAADPGRMTNRSPTHSRAVNPGRGGCREGTHSACRCAGSRRKLDGGDERLLGVFRQRTHPPGVPGLIRRPRSWPNGRDRDLRCDYRLTGAIELLSLRRAGSCCLWPRYRGALDGRRDAPRPVVPVAPQPRDADRTAVVKCASARRGAARNAVLRRSCRTRPRRQPDSRFRITRPGDSLSKLHNRPTYRRNS